MAAGSSSEVGPLGIKQGKGSKRIFSNGEYCKVFWPSHLTVAQSFGPPGTENSIAAVNEVAEALGVVFQHRGRARKKRPHGSDTQPPVILQMSGPVGNVVPFYRKIRSMAGEVTGALHLLTRPENLHLREIENMIVKGPLQRVAAVTEPITLEVMEDHGWGEDFQPDWGGASDSEPEIIVPHDTGDTSEDPTCTRGQDEQGVQVGGSSSSGSAPTGGEAVPPQQGVFQGFGMEWNFMRFNPAMEYEHAAFNNLLFRAARLLQDTGHSHKVCLPTCPQPPRISLLPCCDERPCPIKTCEQSYTVS